MTAADRARLLRQLRQVEAALDTMANELVEAGACKFLSTYHRAYVNLSAAGTCVRDGMREIEAVDSEPATQGA